MRTIKLYDYFHLLCPTIFLLYNYIINHTDDNSVQNVEQRFSLSSYSTPIKLHRYIHQINIIDSIVVVFFK